MPFGTRFAIVSDPSDFLRALFLSMRFSEMVISRIFCALGLTSRQPALSQLFFKAPLRAARAAIFCAAFAGLSPALEAHPQDNSVVAAIGSAVTTLDPADSVDAMTRNVGKSIFESLVVFDESLDARPQLAESWVISEDGRTYEFRLRAGVRFHDGSILDARAVKLSFERLLDKKNALKRREVFSFIERVETTDDPLRVRFVLKSPTSSFLAKLATGSAAIICPSAIEQWDKSRPETLACGTGPFRFKRFVPGEVFEVVRNTDYRIKELPKLDRITWLVVPENHTRATMLRTGEADFVFPVPFEEKRMLLKSPSVRLEAVPGVQARFLTMNMLAPPLDDLRVRQAIAYAIDKAALARVAFGGDARAAEGVLPEAIPGALRLGPWPFDRERAKALLREAGYAAAKGEQGKRLTLPLWSAYPDATSSRVLQFLQQQLRAVGIDTKLRLLESGERSALVTGNKVAARAPNRLYYTGWSNSASEPDWGLRPIFDSRKCPPVLQNTAYYSNPEVDRLLDEALAETDEAKRSTLYDTLQRTIWSDVPAVFLVYENAASGRRTGLEAFDVYANADFDFVRAYWRKNAQP